MQGMTKYGLKTIVLVALLLACALVASAQPTASPTSLTFTYQVNTTPYPAGKLTATLPKSLGSGYILTASVNSTTTGWLTVTPDSGASPLALTVTVNPTNLNPGSYTGTITLGTYPSSTTATVPVSLSISNPPPALIVAPPQPPPTYYTPGSPSALTFNYTTGTISTDFPFEELDVASNGGTIPFSVAAATAGKSAAWLRVSPSKDVAMANVHTSGVVNLGSYVPIYVSVDFTVLSTLDVGSYVGTITFTNTASSATVVINVNLNISAGAPTIDTIFPTSVLAGPAAGRVPPVVTIYGDNFFTTSEVTLTPDGGVPYPNLTTTLLSRKILQATISPSYLTAPGTFTLTVANGKTLANPTPQEASITFTVADPTVPLITAIVNAASYLQTATQTGSAPNPVPASGAGSTSASPREIIAIFGQNLGPSTVTQVPATTGNFPNFYPSSTTLGTAPNTTTYQVVFSFGVDPTCAGPGCPPVVPVAAPLIMVSSNQINAIVPLPPPTVFLPATGLLTWVQVAETDGSGNVNATDWFTITMLPEDPGVFTFGGLGQGQGAVLNFDVTAGYSINSAKNPAPKGSTISLYATGMGDLMGGVVVTVTDKSSPAQTASMTFPIVVNPSRTSTTAPSVATTSPLPAGVQNTVYTPVTLTGTGGTPPYVWSVTGLPPGMSMNAAGLLTGTPSLAGTYSPTFTLADSSSPQQTVSATLSLTIGPENITVTPSAVPDGVQNVTYTSTTLVAAGGKAPYTWSVAPASPLPPGLSLSATGQLTGKPTAPALYNFSLQVTDSTGTQATPTYTMAVYASPGMAITTPTLPDGMVGVAYTATLGQQGGTAPFVWSVSAGTLPANLALDAAKGVVSGKPSAAGSSVVTFLVTDSTGLSATYTITITIAAAIQITTAALPAPLYQYEALPALAIQATGGTPPYKWTATGLPPGLVLDRNTGVLSGVPLMQVSLPLIDGAVSLGAVYLNDNTYRVDIDGQPAVTSYAGAAQGSVAGLVQINAVVPPTARTGTSIPLTVSIGTPVSARRSQLGVTLSVK